MDATGATPEPQTEKAPLGWRVVFRPGLAFVTLTYALVVTRPWALICDLENATDVTNGKNVPELFHEVMIDGSSVRAV